MKEEKLKELLQALSSAEAICEEARRLFTASSERVNELKKLIQNAKDNA